MDPNSGGDSAALDVLDLNTKLTTRYLFPQWASAYIGCECSLHTCSSSALHQSLAADSKSNHPAASSPPFHPAETDPIIAVYISARKYISSRSAGRPAEGCFFILRASAFRASRREASNIGSYPLTIPWADWGPANSQAVGRSTLLLGCIGNRYAFLVRYNRWRRADIRMCGFSAFAHLTTNASKSHLFRERLRTSLPYQSSQRTALDNLEHDADHNVCGQHLCALVRVFFTPCDDED